MNNLHNHAVALANYHANHMHLPPGRNSGRITPEKPPLGFSWAAYTLPYIEQTSLQDAIDYRVAWNAPANEIAVKTRLSLFQCPSSEEIFTGESDYSGINGTAMVMAPAAEDWGIEDLDKVLNRGVLIPCRSEDDGVNFSQVTDGLSNTLAVAESPVWSDWQENYWASGTICMSHDSGPVNNSNDGIFSDHPGGAHAARADESVSFLTDDVPDYIIGALCTRDAGD